MDATDANEYSAGTRPWPVDFITVLPEKTGNAWAALGTAPLGKVYYDTDNGAAGRRYDVDPELGAAFILRPDGFIGARFPLTPKSSANINSYLIGLLH